MSRTVSKAEQCANIDNDWRKALDLHIATRTSQMDWLGFEAVLRAYIRDSKNHDLDLIVGEFTLRGYELEEQKGE